MGAAPPLDRGHRLRRHGAGAIDGMARSAARRQHSQTDCASGRDRSSSAARGSSHTATAGSGDHRHGPRGSGRPGIHAAFSTMPQAASHQVPPMDAPASVSPGRATASPLFGEGQRVTVMGNPTAPGEMVQLTLDPAGAKAGPAIRPGATLSILDGDLQPSGWVYSVRSDDGVKGWVSEKRLRMKF